MDLLRKLRQTTLGLLHDLDADPFARRLLAGTITADEYAFFLAQTYLYVRQTRPLLERAARRLSETTDRAELSALFQQKADEEEGHERWALADLRALGRSADVAPTPAVSAYIAWNRFTVECGSPVAFLGTAYVLEALSAARAAETVNNLARRSGIPGIEGAVVFLTGHADADVDHIEQLGRWLAVVAESTADRDDVLVSAMVTRATYAKLVAEITARTSLPWRDPPIDGRVSPSISDRASEP